MRRRDFIIAGGAVLSGLSAGIALATNTALDRPKGLNDLAKEKGLFFGCAVNDGELAKASSSAAILADCGLVTAQRAQKWPIMWRDRAKESPQEADRLAAFARSNGLGLRGHALIYDAFMPTWVNELSPQEMRVAFERRIKYAAGRWKGQMHSWDVVNEALEPNEGRADSLRNTVFLKALGDGYIADAFFLAEQYDPAALLCYNDYNLESNVSFSYRRRRATLALLESLKKKGAPISALGVQAHLKPQLEYDDRIWRNFLHEVAQLDLKIIVSELDVNDRMLSGGAGARDVAVANLTSRFLDVTLDEKNVLGVISWGLDDQESWMNARRVRGDPDFVRGDRAAFRPLPLDSEFRKKPMWHAIAKAFCDAPVR